MNPVQSPSLRFYRHPALLKLVLMMVLMRAYVPVGFMPVSGNPLLLEICAVALAAQMPAHHHHHQGTHAHFENCPYGSASSAAPAPAAALQFQPPAPASLPQATLLVPAPPATARSRTHQPRAPPALV